MLTIKGSERSYKKGKKTCLIFQQFNWSFQEIHQPGYLVIWDIGSFRSTIFSESARDIHVKLQNLQCGSHTLHTQLLVSVFMVFNNHTHTQKIWQRSLGKEERRERDPNNCGCLWGTVDHTHPLRYHHEKHQILKTHGSCGHACCQKPWGHNIRTLAHSWGWGPLLQQRPCPPPDPLLHQRPPAGQEAMPRPLELKPPTQAEIPCLTRGHPNHQKSRPLLGPEDQRGNRPKNKIPILQRQTQKWAPRPKITPKSDA